jgi:ribonuclease BN (tRNA processing enzyme)
MNNTLKIVPIGVGDAFSEKYYSSGLWLNCDGCSILIDCAHPIRKSMREAAVSSGCDIGIHSLDAIVITHLHADHASGLEGVGFFTHYLEQRTLSLLAHEEVLADIWPWHLKGTMAPACDPPEIQRSFADFFQPVSLSSQEATTFGPYQIECRRTIHHVPTFALRIRVGHRTFGYSSDTSYDESLVEWLAEADLFVHETNGGSHTPYEKLASLPAPLKNKMRLIHYPDDFDCASAEIKPLIQGGLIEL